MKITQALESEVIFAILESLESAYPINATRLENTEASLEANVAVTLGWRAQSERVFNAIAIDEETPSEVAPRRTWSLYFAKGFLNQTREIDTKIQGRVLKAICEIAEEPLVARGDTKKPLAENLRGFWRYRIGDFRLIYQADGDSQTVHCIAFLPRGDAYK